MKKIISTISILLLSLLSNHLVAQVNCSTIHLKAVGKTDINCGDSINLYAYMNKDWEIKANGFCENLKSVFFTSTSIGYCVGTGGLILKTTDGGITWNNKTSGTVNNLNSVYFANASVGIIVGDTGTILKTTDGGETWSSINSSIVYNIYSVCCMDSNRFYACGDNGLIANSKNSGDTWSFWNMYQPGLYEFVFYANHYTDTVHPNLAGTNLIDGSGAFFDSTTYYITPDLVYLYNQHDNCVFYSSFSTIPPITYHSGSAGHIVKRVGENTTLKTSGTTKDLYSIYFPSTLIGYSVGQNGTIIKTIDSAFTWSIQNSGTNQDLNSVYFINNNLGYAVGNNNTILKTIDGGTTWQNYFGNTNALSSMYFTDIATGIAVGDKGTILKTVDTANSWQQKISGIKSNLIGVHFLNFTTGLAVGDSGKIIKTSTSGNAWSLQTSGTITHLKSVYMISDFYAVAVGEGGKVIRSSDRGSSWENITSNTVNTLNSVFFNGTSNGYAVGASGTIIRSIDGGASWNTVLVGIPNNLTSVYFPSSTIGYAVGFGGKIIKTTNGGMTWVSLTSGITNNLWSVFFKDVNTGYAVGDNGKIISTVNGGDTWAAEISNTSTSLGTVFMCNNMSFAAADSGIILRNNAIDINSNNYLWQPYTALNDQNIYNPVAKPLTTTTYTVTVIQGNGCPSITDSVILIVAQLTVDATGGQTINCGDTVQLGVTQNFEGNNYTYSWSPIQGLDNPNIKSPKASPETNTVYKVTVNTNNGCGSPKDSTYTSMTVLPATEICLVSVVNNKNKIFWDKLFETAIDSFYIYKETEVPNIYQKIGTTNYNDSSVFIDISSNADIESNKYKISIKDKCLLEGPQSNGHKTMHLTINQGMDTTWNLMWEPYEGFTVSTYRILRGTTPNNLSLIGTTSGSSTQYTDNTAPAGNLYYQLEVISPNMCNPTKNINKSVSNIATNNPVGGVSNTNYNEEINCYPNPVSDELVIEINGNKEITKYEVYNSNGQLIISGNLIDKTIINTSKYACGIYLIKLNRGNLLSIKKFVKK